MLTRAGCLIVCLLALGAAPSAVADPVPGCKERTAFLRALGAGYSEAPVAMGLTATGAVLEVMASDQGTWTIIVTLPNGTSCAVASGDAWQALAGRRGPKV